MTPCITKEKLEIFNRYVGDIDHLLRINKPEEIETFGVNLNSDWALIFNTLQDLHLISGKTASYEYTKQTLTRLEEITNDISFPIFIAEITFYNDFQKIRDILEQIKTRVKPDADTIWAGYNNAAEFLADLDEDIEKIRFCDFSTLQKLEVEFAPTCTYQELALSNGWSKHYLKLAENFDYLHHKITSSNHTTDQKKWWQFWSF